MLVAGPRSERVATASFIPRLRTVSIIPGIENFDPDRTDTRRGVPSAAPRVRPVFDSRRLTASSVSLPHVVGQRAGIEVAEACLGGERESGWHRQPDPGHRRQPVSLSAEKVLAGGGPGVEVVCVHGAIVPDRRARPARGEGPCVRRPSTG
jgi:hypothetical protein